MDTFAKMLFDYGKVLSETAAEHDPTAHWDGKTKCPYCDGRFLSLRVLDHHIKSIHNSGL